MSELLLDKNEYEILYELFSEKADFEIARFNSTDSFSEYGYRSSAMFEEIIPDEELGLMTSFIQPELVIEHLTLMDIRMDGTFSEFSILHDAIHTALHTMVLRALRSNPAEFISNFIIPVSETKYIIIPPSLVINGTQAAESLVNFWQHIYTRNYPLRKDLFELFYNAYTLNKISPTDLVKDKKILRNFSKLAAMSQIGINRLLATSQIDWTGITSDFQQNREEILAHKNMFSPEDVIIKKIGDIFTNIMKEFPNFMRTCTPPQPGELQRLVHLETVILRKYTAIYNGYQNDAYIPAA